MLKNFKQKNKKGFTIFFATLVASLALAIGLAIYDITVRQLDLSTTVIQSEYAIYAADSGVECALYWDTKNAGGSVFAGAAEGSGSLQKRVYLTSGSSWTVPEDWNNSSNTIEAIGGGDYGNASGGGGGGYAKISNLTLIPGSPVSYQVGAGGTRNLFVSATDSWFKDHEGNIVLLARAGNISVGGGTGAPSVGSVTFSGGNGGGPWTSGGGGGGAGGPGGQGGNGGSGFSNGANAGGDGGDGGGGVGGQGGAGVWNGPGEPGGAGAEWGSHGSGGGGGGADRFLAHGGVGGLYGGGGGGNGVATPGADGAPGIIVITYEGEVEEGGGSTSVICGGYDIATYGTPPAPFAPQPTGWTPWVITENGNAATTTFTLTFPPYSYCAKVEVGKVTNVSGSISTTILSHGYNTCYSNAQNQLERLLKVNY